MPQQEKYLESYFFLFYFSINAGKYDFIIRRLQFGTRPKLLYNLLLGSLISTILTPQLRSTECRGEDTCFPLAFGIPAILFMVSISEQ